MALDIWVGDEHMFVVSEEFYWFAHPHFELLARRAGKYVDLYGDVYFEGGHLLALERSVAEIRSLVEAGPEEWAVEIGKTAQGPVTRDAVKVTSLNQTREWMAAVERAKATGHPLRCFGD